MIFSRLRPCTPQCQMVRITSRRECAAWTSISPLESAVAAWRAISEASSDVRRCGRAGRFGTTPARRRLAQGRRSRHSRCAGPHHGRPARRASGAGQAGEDAAQIMWSSSIFVNPTPVRPARGSSTRYPRDEAGDLAKLASVGCDLVWAPTTGARCTPAGFATRIEVGGRGGGAGDAISARTSSAASRPSSASSSPR